MSSQSEREHLESLLKIYERNLRYNEQRAGKYGGEDQIPLALMNELLETREKIAELQAKLGIVPPKAVEAPRLTTPQTSQPQTPAVQGVQLTMDFQPATTTDTIIVWRAPGIIGREATTFKMPFNSDELPLIIRALDVLQYPHYPHSRSNEDRVYFAFTEQEQDTLDAYGLWKGGRVTADAYEVIGEHLFAGLDVTGQNVLKAVRNFGFGQNLPITYVLRFPANAIALAALPWELLRDVDKKDTIFVRSGGNGIDSVERYVDIDVPVRPPTSASEKLHILALSPHYSIPDVIRENEREERQAIWDRLRAQNKLTYDELSPVTVRMINNYLYDAAQKPDIIHYYGHGTYVDGRGYLLFDDGKGGKDMVSVERLQQLFGNARLVVLCACESATIDTHGLLTGIAPAVSVKTNAVVAMQLSVASSVASRFEEIFYRELLERRKTVQDSVAKAREILFTEGESWYVPSVYIRSRDTQPVRILSE